MVPSPLIPALRNCAQDCLEFRTRSLISSLSVPALGVQTVFMFHECMNQSCVFSVRLTGSGFKPTRVDSFLVQGLTIALDGLELAMLPQLASNSKSYLSLPPKC